MPRLDLLKLIIGRGVGIGMGLGKPSKTTNGVIIQYSRVVFCYLDFYVINSSDCMPAEHLLAYSPVYTPATNFLI